MLVKCLVCQPSKTCPRSLPSPHPPRQREITVFISLEICSPNRKRVGKGRKLHLRSISHIPNSIHKTRVGSSTPLKNHPLVWNHQLPPESNLSCKILEPQNNQVLNYKYLLSGNEVILCVKWKELRLTKPHLWAPYSLQLVLMQIFTLVNLKFELNSEIQYILSITWKQTSRMFLNIIAESDEKYV